MIMQQSTKTPVVEWTESDKREIDRVVHGLNQSLVFNRVMAAHASAALMLLAAEVAVKVSESTDAEILEEFRKCIVQARIGQHEGGVQ